MIIKDEKHPLIEGFTENITNEHYHANRTHLSSSALKVMLKDGKLFYEQYVMGLPDESDKPQAAFDFGSYIHSRILEPHKIKDEYAFYDGKTKSGKAWEAFKAEHADRIIMSASQVDMADKMMHSYENSGIEIGRHGYDTKIPFTNFFRKGRAELTACSKINGIDVKVRFDYYKSKDDFASINDVKTTSEGFLSKDAVQDICDRYDYDLSAALYCDVATQITGQTHDFYFLFCSKRSPFDVRLFRASEGMLERGRMKYTSALEKIAEARDTGVYYESKITELD